MKGYAVSEIELDVLAHYNNGSLVVFSLAGLFSGFATDCLKDWIVLPAAIAGPLSLPLAVGSGLVALIFASIGGFLLYKRRGLIQSIKSQATSRG